MAPLIILVPVFVRIFLLQPQVIGQGPAVVLHSTHLTFTETTSVVLYRARMLLVDVPFWGYFKKQYTSSE